ncbi:MAG: recombinase family protein [Lactobacillus sp.]|nr:recombinase family protein [Lactobacillus sp.]
MIYGYCRVSTRGQATKFSLEQQQQEILARYERAKIYKEQFTGTKVDRPVFNEVIAKLEKGDTLVVTKLDRLARNTVEGINIVKSLFEKGVSVHVLAIGLLENTTTGQFFLTTLLAVAEMERNIIVERTQAGKEVARQRADFKEGRPRKYNPERVAAALEFIEAGNTYRKTSQIYNIPVSTLHDRMREKKAKAIIKEVDNHV